MGEPVVNRLTEIRQEISESLEGAGISTVTYVETNIIPPCALVVPGQFDYVTQPVGENPYRKPYSVNVQVLLIGEAGTSEGVAEDMDSMLVDAINALDSDWDITEVTAPHDANIRNKTYGAAVISLTVATDL